MYIINIFKNYIIVWYNYNRGEDMDSLDQILYETHFSTKETANRMRIRYSEEEILTMLYSQNTERDRLIKKYQNVDLPKEELMKLELANYMTTIINLINQEYGDVIPQDRLQILNNMLGADSVVVINNEQDEHDFSADSKTGKVIVNLAKIGKTEPNSDIYTQMAVANGTLPHELFHIIIQMLKPEELADERMVINLSNGQTITSRGMVGFMLNEGFVEKFSSEFCNKYKLYHQIAPQYLPYVDVCNYIMQRYPNVNSNTIFSLDEQDILGNLSYEEQEKYYTAETVSYAVRHKNIKAEDIINSSIEKIELDYSNILPERMDELKKYYFFKNSKFQETNFIAIDYKHL